MKNERMTALGILLGFGLTLFFYACLYWESVRTYSLVALLAAVLGLIVWALLWSLGVMVEWAKETHQKRGKKRSVEFLNRWWWGR